MENDWILIFETNKEFEADIIRGMLEENNIEVVTMNKKDSAYLIGTIELYVFHDNAMMAKTLILNFNS